MSAYDADPHARLRADSSLYGFFAVDRNGNRIDPRDILSPPPLESDPIRPETKGHPSDGVSVAENRPQGHRGGTV